MSRQDCEDAEDMDRFDETPGWKTPFSARKVAETDAERTAREAKVNAAAAAKQAEKDEAAAHEAKIRPRRQTTVYIVRALFLGRIARSFETRRAAAAPTQHQTCSGRPRPPGRRRTANVRLESYFDLAYGSR